MNKYRDKIKTRINPVVLDWNQKYSSELMVFNTYLSREIQIQVCIYTYIPMLHPLRGPGNRYPIAMSTLSLVSKHPALLNETRTSWGDMAGSN